MKSCPVLALSLLLTFPAFGGRSVITARLDDSNAVYVTRPAFEVHADGKTDDSAVIQAAIDKAYAARQGIVFLPPGRYAVARTVYVRAGIRLIGYGATRPVFMLPDRSPGFQKGMGVMFMFVGARPGGAYDRGPRVPVPPPGTVPPLEVPDANSGTFYSAISNVDFEIGVDNPAAVAIRFHVAQHAFLTHIDFHLGSALAGVYQAGNEAEDLHFYGGRYGILTEKTSPAWQFTLIDSSFEDQRDAAIREHEAGLTLVRDSFRNAPVAIEIDPHYYDQLWVKDCRFENISRAGVIISSEKSRLNEIGFENAVLVNVPTFALFRESGKKLEAKGRVYQVKEFNYGVIVPAPGQMGEIGTRYESSEPGAAPPPERAIPPLPRSEDWLNVRTLGVTGDGVTDDTAALQKAIDEHRVLYFPSGRYLVHDTLTLKPDTVLIGLHPTQTQIDLADDSPDFRDVGPPRALISAPRGGVNILSGLGVSTGGINPRAVAVLWRAGEHSMIDDVRFLGGHGIGINPYNNNQTADPDLRRRWDGQYPSLWVTDDGGGTFADIWTPNTFAQAGLYVSDTKTPGHVYEISVEHHVRNEIKLERVENWEFAAPQTEEESGESPESLSLEISNCRNLTVANYHAYRVTRSRAPYPTAVRVYNSSRIRFRNVHVNGESGYAFCDAEGCGTFLRAGKYSYENAIRMVTQGLEVRDREFAAFDVGEAPARAAEAASRVRKLADGFFSIAGTAVDSSGKLYFVDRHQQRIYAWSEREGLTIERDSPLDPVNLAFDRSGNLLVLSSRGPAGTVYTFRPGTPIEQTTVLKVADARPRPGARVILPVNYWNNGEFRDQLNLDTLEYKSLAEMFREDVSTPKAKQYVPADGSIFLPAGRVVQQGPPDARGWRFSDNLDTYGFLSAAPGDRVYVSNSSEDVTYSGRVNADGTLVDLQVFADRGGEGVAADREGNVYVLNGQVFVYDKSGRATGRIDVPERPIALAFGGSDGRTLFLLSHHSLYAVGIR
ncbi:MAG TPA: glycosyl hydrolase family 28-related protein [Verrucomicrobiae bacterium]|nr:glycosyl hydrolase family 28-related protein [Verrucomicrobiae bacterium]